jgi:putative membrane protein
MTRPSFTTATAPEPRDVPLRARPVLGALLAAYGTVWTWCAVAPLDRAEWALEQLLPAGWLLFLGLAWRKQLVRLSDASCAALAVFLALHAVGARYGYEATPAGAWLAAHTGGGVDGVSGAAAGAAVRNPYDRLVHLAFGVLLGYVGRELWLRFGRIGRFARAWASAHAWVAVLAASAVYEILEWGAARLFAPGLGSAFVGAQGDVWDAPADMAMAAFGATGGLALVEIAHRVRAARAARAAARAAALPAGGGVYQPVAAARRHGTRIRTPATG